MYILVDLSPLRVSDASGSLEVSEAGKFPVKREMLDTKVSDITFSG